MSRLLSHCLEFMINTPILCRNTSWILDMHVWNVLSISCQQNADFWSDGSPKRTICVRVEDDEWYGDRIWNVFPSDRWSSLSERTRSLRHESGHSSMLTGNESDLHSVYVDIRIKFNACVVLSFNKENKSFCMIQWQSEVRGSHGEASVVEKYLDRESRSWHETTRQSLGRRTSVIMTWKGKVRIHEVVRTYWRFQ